MIIAKSDNIPIEIHETKYRGHKYVRIRSVGGINRDIDIIRLKLGDEESILTTFGGSHTLPNRTAFKYYENVKHYYLKAFGLKKVVK